MEKNWKLGNSPSHLWILLAASVEFWLNDKPVKVWHKLPHCRKPNNAEIQSSAAAFPVLLDFGVLFVFFFFLSFLQEEERKGEENESYY